MKRFLCFLAMLCLAACPLALAERTIYAEHNGVRVFTEDGHVGLMDADGAVLLPAEYDVIEPFEGDYAYILSDGLWGVVRRDGTVTIDCAWKALTSYKIWPFMPIPEGQSAVCAYNDWNERFLLDLDTGETLLSGEYLFWMDEEHIYALSYGYYDGWGGTWPPFETKVFDRDFHLLFSTPTEIQAYLGDGLYTATDEATSGFATRGTHVLGSDGAVLLRDIWFYEGEYDEGTLPYSRSANPLRTMLTQLGFDTERIRHILRHRLGLPGSMEQGLMRVLDDISFCGVLKSDGTLTETLGDTISKIDDAGYFRVCVDDLYGYMDEAGRFAIPPRYRIARAFVDGSAAVSEDGETMFLIGPDGARVGDATWHYDEEQTLDLEQPILCVPAGDGLSLLLLDRTGTPLTDESYPITRREPCFLGGRIALKDRENQLCVIDAQGRTLLRTPIEGFWGPLERYGAIVPDVLAVNNGSSWLDIENSENLLFIDGERSGELFLAEDAKRIVPDQGRVVRVTRNDGTFWFYDLDAGLLGPAEDSPFR